MRGDCARCLHLQRWLKDPKHDTCLAHRDWYPMGLIVYCREQVLWLCKYIDIEDGRLVLGYPPDPRGTGYTDAPINSKVYGSHAPFEMARLISADIGSRLEACGLAGLLLMKCVQKGETFQELLPEAKSALNYCSGNRQRHVGYVTWKRIKRNRAKERSDVTLFVTKTYQT